MNFNEYQPSLTYRSHQLIDKYARRFNMIKGSSEYNRLADDVPSLVLMLVLEMSLLDAEQLESTGICSQHFLRVHLADMKKNDLIGSFNMTMPGVKNFSGSYPYYVTGKGVEHLMNRYDIEAAGLPCVVTHDKKKRPSSKYVHDRYLRNVILEMMTSDRIRDIEVEFEYEVKEVENRKSSVVFRVDARVVADGKEYWIEHDNGTEYRKTVYSKLLALSDNTYRFHKDATIIFTSSKEPSEAAVRKLCTYNPSVPVEELRNIEKYVMQPLVQIDYNRGDAADDEKRLTAFRNSISSVGRDDEMPNVTKGRYRKVSEQLTSLLGKRLDITTMRALTREVQEEIRLVEAGYEIAYEAAMYDSAMKRLWNFIDILEDELDYCILEWFMFTTLDFYMVPVEHVTDFIINDLLGIRKGDKTQYRWQRIAAEIEEDYEIEGSCYDRFGPSMKFQNGRKNPFIVKKVLSSSKGRFPDIYCFGLHNSISDYFTLRELMLSELEDLSIALVIDSRHQFTALEERDWFIDGKEKNHVRFFEYAQHLYRPGM